jgi:hypothetical protein
MQSLEDRALVQRQLGPNSKSGSSQWRGSTQVTGYIEVIRVDVNPAFLQHHTLIDKWTTCRLHASVDFRSEMRAIAFQDPAAFSVTNPSESPKLKLDERFALLATSEDTFRVCSSPEAGVAEMTTQSSRLIQTESAERSSVFQNPSS